jgi:hypothetical protein
MAVLSLLPGITVEVLIGGEPAQEYNNDDDKPHQPEKPISPLAVRHQELYSLSKHIQSETSQFFSIRFTVGPPYIRGNSMPHVKIGFHVKVDDKEAGTIWLSRTWFKYRDGAIWTEEMKGVKEGKGQRCTVKPFKFAKIETHSDFAKSSKIESMAEFIKPVGMIEVKVFNETAGENGGDITATSEGFLSSNGLTVPEKSTKATSKSHGTA